MDNLRAVIKNLFYYIDPQLILNNREFYRRINIEDFVELGNSYIRRYSNDELKNMYQFMKNEFAWYNRKLIGSDLDVEQDQFLNVFDSLLTFNYSILIEENLEPKCQYGNLLRWREIITYFEEDLFVTSFLAKNDLLKGKKRNNFFWKIVIGHNNLALNKMLEQGVAENHFHLKGSAPMFHLSWINLMNEPDNIRFKATLDEYNNNRLQRIVQYNGIRGNLSYTDMWRKAAVIRLYLFSFITNSYLEIPNFKISVNEVATLCDWEERRKLAELFDLSSKEMIQIEDRDVISRISDDSYSRIKKRISKKWINKLLTFGEIKETDILIMRQNIERIKENHKRKDANDYQFDYTLGDYFITQNPDHAMFQVICGERWLMYSMFRHVYEEQADDLVNNLFYAYLVLKTHIRNEIIQSNMNVGFDNFLLYQERKENFIDNTQLEPIYLKMAIRDTLNCQPIKMLEARIAPKKTSEDLRKAIKKYDDFICKDLMEDERECLIKKYFYIVHFIKEKDSDESIHPLYISYRHFAKRQEVKEQALSIAALREKECAESKRIMGIDASSSEILCRPEVFSHAFRFLKAHTPDTFYKIAGLSCSRLMATYHVGEDFLDVVDGLRAIDEAINFLSLKCGDRLGHALALGIDPGEWYESKANKILLSKQAYLDNLSWLYAKIRKYGILDSMNVQNYIIKKMSSLLQEIYINFISDDDIDEVRNKYVKYAKLRNMGTNITYNIGAIDYNQYYDSMKLRGDDPDLYREGFFKNPFANLDEWDAYAVNRDYPNDYQIRYNPTVAYLYHMYHYNADVRRIGNEMIEVKINPNIIHVIKEVQYNLQLEIANSGIGIETNPSSNYLIGTFRRYDKHPIVNWYNNGLTFEQEALKRCPQIQVSINTDDQGVFATYIENEYAYMALALEKFRDENGIKIYNRTMIMQWLDNIRKMGLAQSFYQDVCSED